MNFPNYIVFSFEIQKIIHKMGVQGCFSGSDIEKILYFLREAGEKYNLAVSHSLTQHLHSLAWSHAVAQALTQSIATPRSHYSRIHLQKSKTPIRRWVSDVQLDINLLLEHLLDMHLHKLHSRYIFQHQ